MEKVMLLKKTGKITANILLYVFIALCLLGVVSTIVANKDSDGTATVLGLQLRVVQSPSMEKSEYTDVSAYRIKDIPTRSVVLVRVVPKDAAEAAKWYEDLEPGDVLTFKYAYVTQETITHRLVKKDGSLLYLEGDNKSDKNGALTQVIDTSETNGANYVIGKVVGVSYLLGLFLSALRSPVGLVLIVIIPSIVIIAMELIKLSRLGSADRRKREQQEREEQQSELDELRRRLAALEADKPTPAPDAPPDEGNNGNLP